MVAATCSLCHLPGATLQAGGDLGLVHPPCFRDFDRRCEAEELFQAGLTAALPPPVRGRRAKAFAFEVACG
jgi:hypothetical protein